METLERLQTTELLSGSKYGGIVMSKADFLRWESDDDEFVYEFDHGLLDPTRSMQQKEAHIIANINYTFYTTTAFQQRAQLIPEIDVWVNDSQRRRPDLAFFTADQIRAMADGQNEIPVFAVEILSDYDEVNKQLKKFNEYFAAGVQVVWWIIPDLNMVYCYTSPKIITVATGADSLSAAPAIPELALTVNELFRR
jgi:Uma2 family endonuclease